MNLHSHFSTIIIGLCLLAAHPNVTAKTEQDKPFIEKRVVLQISDMTPDKQSLVLNVASNLIKHYGPDKVDVEVVAFGPGLRLLLKSNQHKDRISSLNENGVRFAACMNTINHFRNVLGEEPVLQSGAYTVSAGVVRILELTSQGYTLIRP